MRKTSVGYLFIGAFIFVALAVIVAGFLFIGAPSEQRQIALDKKRSGDLVRIEIHIGIYSTKHSGNLPSSLADIPNRSRLRLEDPVSGEPYTYRVTGEGAYQLCAMFARRNDDGRKQYPVGQFERHEQGVHCFDLKVEPQRTMF